MGTWDSLQPLLSALLCLLVWLIKAACGVVVEELLRKFLRPWLRKLHIY